MVLYTTVRSLLSCIFVCALCTVVEGWPVNALAPATDVRPDSTVPPPPSKDQPPNVAPLVQNPPPVVDHTPSFAVLQGVSKLPNSIQQRLSIQTLQKNDQQWHLYLISLNRLQDMDQAQKLSYYQVAGIHGRPFIPWDGVNPAPGQENSGYATHSSTLFPVWHRAYLALFEQILYGIVQEVAVEFNSPQYTAAAETFRIPYWDWAAPIKPDLPDTVCGSAYINIVLPNGTETIRNPLYQYNFHGGNLADLGGSPVSGRIDLFDHRNSS